MRRLHEHRVSWPDESLHTFKRCLLYTSLVIATVLAGALGLADDGEKVVKERSLGLTPKAKLIGQFLIATVFCLVAVNFLGIEPTAVSYTHLDVYKRQVRCF